MNRQIKSRRKLTNQIELNREMAGRGFDGGETRPEGLAEVKWRGLRDAGRTLWPRSTVTDDKGPAGWAARRIRTRTVPTWFSGRRKHGEWNHVEETARVLLVDPRRRVSARGVDASALDGAGMG